MALQTPKPDDWSIPDWLIPESDKVAAEWWLEVEEQRMWPETFREAFQQGYLAGYRRGQRYVPETKTEDG